MIVSNNKFVMFGGILEITKESDEIFIFDPASSNWTILDMKEKNDDFNKSLSTGLRDDFNDTELHPARKNSPSIFKKGGRHAQS